MTERRARATEATLKMGDSGTAAVMAKISTLQPASTANAGSVPDHPDGRRVNFNLNPRAAAELERISTHWHLTIAQVFRFALTLAKIYFDEAQQNNRIAVVSEDGRILREIIPPM